MGYKPKKAAARRPSEVSKGVQQLLEMFPEGVIRG